MGQDAGLSSAHGHRDTGCSEATLQPFRSQRALPGIPTKPGKISAHPSYATNVHVQLRSRRGQALQQHRRTNAFGTLDRERLQVYNERVTRVKEWSKVYVEGLP